MNFSQTLETIESSKEYKDFKKENEDAYFCAGFFVLNLGQGADTQQLDYSLNSGKIFTFSISEAGEVAFKEAEKIEGKEQKLGKLSKEVKVDLDKIEEILKKEMEKREMNNKITKIIAVLQENEGKQIWNLNCILDSFGILQVHIDSDSGEVLKFEKKNIFDFVKQIK